MLDINVEVSGLGTNNIFEWNVVAGSCSASTQVEIHNYYFEVVFSPFLGHFIFDYLPKIYCLEMMYFY